MAADDFGMHRKYRIGGLRCLPPETRLQCSWRKRFPTLLMRFVFQMTVPAAWGVSLTTSLAVSLVCLSSARETPATPATRASISTVFEDITEGSGVNFHYVSSHTAKKYLIETMGSGVALFDYDNDGRLDIFLINGAPIADPTPKGTIPQKDGPRTWNRLYHQKPDGTFEDVTEKAGLQGIGYGMGVAVGDYDNDGNEDLFVTGYGRNTLYHNNGDGTFTDVTARSGLTGSGWSTSAAWVDYDNDGLLDLVVLRYVTWDWDDYWCGEHREGYRAYCHPDLFSPIAPLLYHNDGNGRFTEVTQQAGFAKPGKGLGVAIGDYDKDGRPDIVIANDSMPEFLYHNDGGGKFSELGLESEVALDDNGKTYAGMGVDFADYDNDGWPDLVVTNLANQRYALYRNTGEGSFNFASGPTGIAAMTVMHSGWGVRFLDFDNDGWKDLLIAQGHDLDTVELTSPQLHYRESVLLAKNICGKSFVDVTASSGAVFAKKWVARGLATGDLDNDGRVDAVITTNDGPAYILRNVAKTSNHWISLQLTGHKSNRDAIGAQIQLTTKDGSQYAMVSTAGSYLSASDKRVHFGLGPNTEAKSIEIRWPSGIVQNMSSVRGDRLVKIEEPSGAKENN
jgi:enediyne biosynthesis protein E4